MRNSIAMFNFELLDEENFLQDLYLKPLLRSDKFYLNLLLVTYWYIFYKIFTNHLFEIKFMKCQSLKYVLK